MGRFAGFLCSMAVAMSAASGLKARISGGTRPCRAACGETSGQHALNASTLSNAYTSKRTGQVTSGAVRCVSVRAQNLPNPNLPV